MLDRLFRRKPEPLTGAPSVRRMKTYAAQNGVAYRYYYLGHRGYRRAGGQGTEYVFDVSAGRADFEPVSVLVGDKAVASWESRHGRALIAAERYAVAKMALFQAFDEHEEPLRGPLAVRPADLDAILDTLGIE
jgi:hypothetical protein